MQQSPRSHQLAALVRPSRANLAWLGVAGAALVVVGLLVASALPLSACGGKCTYCETNDRAARCTGHSVQGCPSNAECSVRVGCVCSGRTSTAGVCVDTNLSCDLYDSQISCEAAKGCTWASGCFYDVDCFTLPQAQCTTHPTCSIVQKGCP